MTWTGATATPALTLTGTGASATLSVQTTATDGGSALSATSASATAPAILATAPAGGIALKVDGQTDFSAARVRLPLYEVSGTGTSEVQARCADGDVLISIGCDGPPACGVMRAYVIPISPVTTSSVGHCRVETSAGAACGSVTARARCIKSFGASPSL